MGQNGYSRLGYFFTHIFAWLAPRLVVEDRMGVTACRYLAYLRTFVFLLTLAECSSVYPRDSPRRRVLRVTLLGHQDSAQWLSLRTTTRASGAVSRPLGEADAGGGFGSCAADHECWMGGISLFNDAVPTKSDYACFGAKPLY